MRSQMVLLVLSVVLTACTGVEQHQPRFTGPSGPAGGLRLEQPRAVHRATLLRDGTVLVTGGCTEAGCGGFDAGRRSELYDPDRGIVAGPRMLSARASGTATLLRDGRVLLAGGYPGEGYPPTGAAEVYNPRSGTFSSVGNLTQPRADHSASLLPDGRVLLAGGFNGSGQALGTTETFDPATDTFTQGPDMSTPRAAHVSVTVRNAVLLVGGTQHTHALGTTDEFVHGGWRFGPRLLTPRVKMGAAAIGSSRVLVVGGATDTEGHERLATTELLDVARGTVDQGPRLSSGEYKLDGAVATLDDGRVVIPSGSGLDVFDPGTSRLTTVEATTYGAYSFRTVTPLPGLRVLVAGGYDDSIVPTAKAVVITIPRAAAVSR